MIYIHVPFCRSFCTYCDFYSEVACRGRDAEAIEAYADELCAEIHSRADEMAATLDVDTLYIGGGTPSVLPLSCLERIVDAVRSVRSQTLTGNEPFEEFTMEVNPDDILKNGPDYICGLKALGVDRISMGVQSLDTDTLRWMNRRHDADGARQAFSMLRYAGFDNISVDVILGVNLDDSSRKLENTVREIVSLHPEHVSAYQLSVEDGSALGTMVRDGRYQEAPEDLCRSQYELVCGMLREAGYGHYEVSNWALPGREAIHNGAYWTRAPYVGLGPGAHSLDASGTIRSWNPQALSGWVADSAGAATCEHLSPEEVLEEQIMLGLRTARGIEASLLSPGPALDEKLCSGQLTAIPGHRIRIPEDHFFVSDDIISDLL